MADVDFTAAAAFDRKLFWERGDSVRYLVARLKAERKDDRRSTERAPVNLALVIDASGSMGGGKLEAAKSAALGLIRRLSERDRISIVSFASDVIVHLDAVAVTSANAARIEAEISRLETRGMTFLSGGWFAGVECAARIAEEDPRLAARVIILSDGHANEGIVDAEELREHAGELRARAVLTSCLGIGDGYDEQLLRGIAESGGGRLHDAELTSEISSVLLGELDDIFGTVLEDVQVTLSVPDGMKAEVLGRSNSESGTERLVVSLGALQNETERVVVFKVACPSAARDQSFSFHLTAIGKSAEEGSMRETSTVTATLVATGGTANSSQARDIGIAEIVARTWSANVVSTAARMNRDGAFEEAKRYIKHELRHFRRYVEGLRNGPEMVRDLDLLAERIGREFSSRMRKEMVFQSALLMESRVDRRGTGKASWSARLERGD